MRESTAQSKPLTTPDAARPLLSLVLLLRPYTGRLAGALFFQVVKDSPVWLVPIFTARIIDTIVTHGSVAALWLAVSGAILSLALNVPSHIAYARLYSKTYRSVAVDLRNALTEHLQNLSIGFHTRKNASVIQTKIVRDVENVESLLQQVSPVAGLSASILVGSIVVTALQVPAFLVVYALTVPVAAAIVSSTRRRAGRQNEEFRLRMEGLSAKVSEMAMLVPITRAHGLEGPASRRVSDESESVRQAGMALDRITSRFETTSWVSFQVLSVLCLGGAGFVVLTGLAPISAGQVVLLSTYFATLTSAITQLVGLTPLFSKGLESMRSIAEVLQDSDLEHNEGRAVVEEVGGRITFEGVGYRFPGADLAAIENVDLEIEPGQTVAFVGPSGSGKSTTINLVLGFIRATSGRVLFDGRDMEELDMRTLRRHISVVPQESVLFEGTIFDNVAYGLEDPDPEQVRRALEGASAAEIVDALPEGWNTPVGPRGARLSGGQRQRIAIARALVRDPRILLLDEATSALDGESEARIQRALETLMEGRTSLVVAHRLSTVRLADRIVVMDGGRAIESGTYDDLLALGGRFARLERAQRLG